MSPGVDPVDSFGPYEVYERLGMGGMAMVHRAKKRGIEGFERSVALKRMLQHLAEDASFVDSFIREAKVSSLLHHPNIAQVHDFGRIGGVYYIAMELVAGFDVRKLLRYASKSGDPIPMPVVLSVLGELADALEYAHTFVDESGQHLKIVHRDISPSNLIVAHSGHLKVIDFGIAKANSKQLYTESGQVKGKLGYMSPEAAQGMTLEPVSDIFSMGVVAWELVTASPLFSARTDYETMQRIREAEIAPPSMFNPSCPPELDAIILSALDRDPTRRLPSAAVFRAAIDALATQHGIHHSARHVAEWMVRFAQPGDQWVRPSTQASRHQLPLPPGLEAGGFAPAGDQPTSIERKRTPPVASTKLQRSPEQQKLATEIWGDELPLMTTAAGPDFSVPVSRPSPLPPPLVPQPLPLANVPQHTPTQHPAPSNKKAIAILAVLAIVAGVLAAVLVLKRSERAPSVAATTAPVRFVVEPAAAVIEVAGRQVGREVELAAGTHAIVVRHDGYKPWSSSISVRAGESQTINVVLEHAAVVATAPIDAATIDDDPPRPRPPTEPGPRKKPVAATDRKPNEHGDGEPPKPADKPANKPDKPTEKPIDKPIDKPGDKPIDKPADKPADKPIDKPADKPADKPIDKPVDPPVDKRPPVDPPKPVPPARTPVVATTAVTKLSGEIPKLRSAGGESNGDALVKMCIDEQGKVSSVKVVRSTGAIASELQGALATWRYKPYLNKDRQPSPVCFPLSLRLVFKRAD